MQEFEKYPKLTTYIEKLASYGSCLSGSEWNAFLAALNEALKISSNPLLCDSVLPNYEYEMFFDSEPNEPMQIHGWYPIATDRIRHPEKIDHYIEKGLLRRYTKGKTVA